MRGEGSKSKTDSVLLLLLARPLFDHHLPHSLTHRRIHMHALTMRRGAAYIRFTVDSADPSYKAEWENGATSWSVSFKGWTMGFGRLQFCDWNVVLKIQILVISLGRGWWGVKWGCWEVIWEVEVGWYYVSSSAPPFSLWLGLSWTYSPKKWLDFKFTKGSLTKRVLKLYLSSGISPMQTFYHNLWFCGTRLVNHESRSARL